MKYKPGDKVRVAEHPKNNRNIAFVDPMNCYRGKICTIKEANEDEVAACSFQPYYTLWEATRKYGYWLFVEEWLEPVEDDIPIDENDIIAMIR
jgi:hypothetical protein